MKIFLSGDPFSAGKFLLAMTACAVLAQSAYAGNASDSSSDKYTNTGSVANTRRDITQSNSPLISKKKNVVLIDYANICIFCHIPNLASYPNATPLLNNTTKYPPTTIQRTNSELP